MATPSCLPIPAHSTSIRRSIPNAGYDPRKDFAPIGLIGWQPSVLTVHPSLPARTPSELIAYAKANPGKINYGFVPGTVGHIDHRDVRPQRRHRTHPYPL